MKKSLFYILVVLLAGQQVYADAIITRPRYTDNSAIQSSRILYSTHNIPKENNDSYKFALKEIQNQIEINPHNYSLYIHLADLYLSLGEYQKAFDELTYINTLNKQNKIDEAVKQEAKLLFDKLRKIPKYDKTKSYYYTNMAILALITNNTQLAQEYLIAGLNSNNDGNFVKNALINAIDSIEDVNTAINICDNVLQKKVNDVEIMQLKAKYLMQSDKKTEALQEYIKILDIKPEDEDVKYSIYKLLSAKNASEKEIFKTIYKSDKPDLEKAYTEFSSMLLKNNDISGALEYAKLLVNKYPDNANGYITLSEIYRREGKLKESYDVLSVVRDKADTNEEISKYNVLLAKLSDAPLAEANSLMASGLYEQALEVLESSASQENLYVLLAMSRANYFLKRTQTSLDLLNKAMTLYPNNSDVYCAFSYIYLQEKDIESSRKYINQSLKINPNNSTALTLLDLINNAETDKYHNQIADCIESQNYGEAIRLINEALKINKKDALLYYYRGLTYIAQNNYAASTAELYKCLEFDKNNILANFYLGIAFDNLAEKSNALMYYQKFISMLPNDDFGESERKEYAKSRIEKLKI